MAEFIVIGLLIIFGVSVVAAMFRPQPQSQVIYYISGEPQPQPQSGGGMSFVLLIVFIVLAIALFSPAG